MNSHGYREWNRSKASRTPGGGRDGNIVLMALAGLAIIILIGFGLPRLLQRREPGLDGATPTASKDGKSTKRKSSIFSDDVDEDGGRKPASAKAGKAHKSEEDIGELTSNGGSPEEEDESTAGAESVESPRNAVAPYANEDGFCAPVEEPGRPASDIKLAQKSWMPLVEDFRLSKRKVVEWVKKHPEQFPVEKLAEISERVLDLQIQRPPTEDELDLAWRGMVVLSRLPDGKQLLRVGGGFLSLYARDPARARFELARAVALTLSPCELGKVDLANAWDKPLSCSKGFSKESCEVGSYSNASWLVASAVAVEAQPPGCRIRAVEKSGILDCLKTDSTAFVQKEEEKAPEEGRVPVGAEAVVRDLASEHSKVGGAK